MKQENFNINENYFEELENKILSNVQGFEKRRKQRREILTKIVLPSAIILIFLAGGFSFFQNEKTMVETGTNYLAYNDALEYLDISDYEVTALMDEYATVETSTSDNSDEIIDYLSDYNSIDDDLLTENN
ncbi:MAG: hypothetical protein J7L46_02380 [Bacteroidales bacterium]|nr:hypothetical protein [Bacteroidales bacterium]